MNNQTSGNGGASPKLQPTIDGASNNIGGQGPATDSLTDTSVPTDIVGQDPAPGTMAPDSVKGGHV